MFSLDQTNLHGRSAPDISDETDGPFIWDDSVRSIMHETWSYPEEENLTEDETEDIRRALAEYRSNPVTFGFDEEMERLGLLRGFGTSV